MWPGKACLLDITHVCIWVSSSENEEGFTSLTVELGAATHHRILPMKRERGDTCPFRVEKCMSWCMIPHALFSCLIMKHVESSLS